MVSEIDLSYIFQALSHETRRKMIKILAERGALSFSELMELAGIEETGTFGFHMRRIEDLVEKLDDGRYRLSDLGRLAYSIICFAEGKGDIVPSRPVKGEVKVFNYISKVVIDRSLLEKYSKVGFDYIGKVVFTEDVDEELFRDKVLFFKGVGKIVVPKHLVRLAYSLLDEYCGSVIRYEGKVPKRWLEEKRGVRELVNYGEMVITRRRLEKAVEEGYMLRIENHGTLIIEEDVNPELFERAVFSIDSRGEIYAARKLHRIISDKIESISGGVRDLAELTEKGASLQLA